MWKLFICILPILSTVNFDSAAQDRQGYIDVGNNLKLFYQTVGGGKQKFIVPLGYWLEPDFRHLADDRDRTFIFYDVRGRFRSTAVTDTTLITHEEEVEDIERIRKHFDFQRISLIGVSFTGRVVALYALKYPQHVERVVQIGPIPISYKNTYPDSLSFRDSNVDPEKYKVVKMRYEAGDHKNNPQDFSEHYWRVQSKVNLVADTSYLPRINEQWGSHLKYENEWFDNFSRHMRFHFKSFQQQKFDTLDLKKITAPVLTIAGLKDRNVPFGSAKEYAKHLPNGRLIRVPNAAHIPWIEDPDLVFGAIDAFLDGQWPKSAVDLN